MLLDPGETWVPESEAAAQQVGLTRKQLKPELRWDAAGNPMGSKYTPQPLFLPALCFPVGASH